MKQGNLKRRSSEIQVKISSYPIQSINKTYLQISLVWNVSTDILGFKAKCNRVCRSRTRGSGCIT